MLLRQECSFTFSNEQNAEKWPKGITFLHVQTVVGISLNCEYFNTLSPKKE